MSQMPPSPTLESLKPQNGALEASWTNPPYDNIFDAFLLVVKDYDNTTIKINLTEAEALEEAYVITNLDNDFSYSVTYNLVTVDGDNGGVNGIFPSKTLTATPSIPPLQPVINEIAYDSSEHALVKFSLPLNTSPKNYKSITFNIFNDISNSFLGIQTFNLSGAQLQNGYYQYTIDNLIDGYTYAVSSFLKNECGYGKISNTVTFIQSPNAITTPVLEYADSGLDSKISVKFTVTPSANLKYTIAYKADTDNTWSEITGDVNSTGTMIVNVNNLINLTNYEIKVNCFDSSNKSLYSVIKRAVPMKMPIFTLTPELTVTYKEGDATGFKSFWTYTQGDLLNTNVVSKVSYKDDTGDDILGLDLPATMATNLTQTVSKDIYGSSLINLRSHLSGKVPPINVPFFESLNGLPTNNDPNLKVEPSQVAAGFVAVIPTAVAASSITSISGRTSNTSNTSGVIQIFFEESANNASNDDETQYICNLYTLDPTTTAEPATPLRSVTVTQENATFTGLTVTGIYYWVSVTAFNPAGSSAPQVKDVGSILTVVVPTVTNASASANVANNAIELKWAPVDNSSGDYFYKINTIDEDGSITQIAQDISGSLSSYLTNKSSNSNVTFGIQTYNTDGENSTNVIVSYTYYYSPTIDNVVSTSVGGGNSSVTITVDSNSAGNLIFIAAPEDQTSSPVTSVPFVSSTSPQYFVFTILSSSNFYVIVVNPYGSAIYDSSSPPV